MNQVLENIQKEKRAIRNQPVVQKSYEDKK